MNCPTISLISLLFPKYNNLHNLHERIIDNIISSMIIIDIISSNLTATIPNKIPQGLITSSVELNTFNPSLVKHCSRFD